MRRYLDAPNLYRPVTVHNYVNTNTNNNNNQNANNNGNRGFVAFSGRGTSIG